MTMTKIECPQCKTIMNRSGTIRAGPRGGLRDVYYCPKCGNTIMKPMT